VHYLRHYEQLKAGCALLQPTHVHTCSALLPCCSLVLATCKTIHRDPGVNLRFDNVMFGLWISKGTCGLLERGLHLVLRLMI
jgi:hypothetical protein